MPPGNRLQTLEEAKFLRAVRTKNVLRLLVVHLVWRGDLGERRLGLRRMACWPAYGADLGTASSACGPNVLPGRPTGMWADRLGGPPGAH